MNRASLGRVLGVAMIGVAAQGAAALSGVVEGTDGARLPGVFVGALSPSYEMTAHAVTGPDATFLLETADPDGYLVVQPPAPENREGLGVYAYQPRIIALAGAAGEVVVRVPPAACLVIRACGRDGNLLRWEDFERLGVFGGSFLYATNLDDEMVPAVCWPVHDGVSRETGAPREKGLPALAVTPGDPYVVQVLFWETAGYGKLHLRADNAGAGFIPAKPGDCLVIELNVELARTAVADLERRYKHFHPLSALEIESLRADLVYALDVADPAGRAAAADQVLAKALAARDSLELARARSAIPGLRQGAAAIRVVDADGSPIGGCEVRVAQESHDFQFGVFEGGRYDPKPFEIARRGGFELATVLPAWGWTDAQPGRDWASLDRTLGISALRRLGFKVRAHGVVWLQDYGILPERARAMDANELPRAAIAHERTLLEVWGDAIDLWEVMNEPATTNAVNLPRAAVMQMLRDSAGAVKGVSGKTTLVNGPHEVDYGRKHLLYGLDGNPVDDYRQTYLAFLRAADESGALEQVDVIGLQFYPGYRFNASLGGYQGPAYTPGWLVDTLERYGSLDRPIHITEFSVPSHYGEGWFAGYWREPWNPATQADYAAAVFTLAFGTPSVGSITWWDVTDRKPSVLTGGLVAANGDPKPAFERIRDCIQRWSTQTSVTTDENGCAQLEAFAGHYKATARLDNGRAIEKRFHLPAREKIDVILKAGGAS